MAADRKAVIVPSIEILRKDLVAIAITDQVLIAGIQNLIGTGMNVDERLVVQGAADRILPRLAIQVQNRLVSLVGRKIEGAQGILANQGPLDFAVFVHETNRGMHVDDRFAIDMGRNPDLRKHLLKHGDESLVDRLKEVAIKTQGIRRMVQEIGHLELLGQADIDHAFKISVPKMVLSRNPSFLVEAGKEENVRMGFPVQKIVGKLAQDKGAHPSQSSRIIDAVALLKQKLEKLPPVLAMYFLAKLFPGGQKMRGMERDDAEIEEGIGPLCAEGEKIIIPGDEVLFAGKGLLGFLDVKSLGDEIVGEKIRHQNASLTIVP